MLSMPQSNHCKIRVRTPPHTTIIYTLFLLEICKIFHLTLCSLPIKNDDLLLQDMDDSLGFNDSEPSNWYPNPTWHCCRSSDHLSLEQMHCCLPFGVQILSRLFPLKGQHTLSADLHASLHSKSARRLPSYRESSRSYAFVSCPTACFQQ